MERLTGQDASFLYMETPSVHMHTLKVAVIDLPAKIPYADVFDLVRVSLESKLHLVPRLRWRPPPTHRCCSASGCGKRPESRCFSNRSTPAAQTPTYVNAWRE